MFEYAQNSAKDAALVWKELCVSHPYASWHFGRQRRSSTPDCSGPAWCWCLSSSLPPPFRCSMECHTRDVVQFFPLDKSDPDMRRMVPIHTLKEHLAVGDGVWPKNPPSSAFAQGTPDQCAISIILRLNVLSSYQSELFALNWSGTGNWTSFSKLLVNDES